MANPGRDADAAVVHGRNFVLQGSLRAFDGGNEVCRRDWDRSIPRDFS